MAGPRALGSGFLDHRRLDGRTLHIRCQGTPFVHPGLAGARRARLCFRRGGALDAFPIATAQDYHPPLETTESLSVLLRPYTTGPFDFVIKDNRAISGTWSTPN